MIDLRNVRRVVRRDGMGKLAAEVLKARGESPGATLQAHAQLVGTKLATTQNARRAVNEGLLALAVLDAFTR